MNIATSLSVLHLLLLPVVVYFVSQGTAHFNFLAIIILLLSVLMDMTGKLVESNKITASFLYPFSDKVVVLALLFAFVLQGVFSGIMFGIFLLRDIIISIIRIIASRDDAVIRGELYGKTITMLQFVLVFMILARNIFVPLENSFHLVISIFTGAIVVLGIISILHYGYVYGNALRTR
ncbi:MAG: hypothetical protein A2822_03195, partial [Candidatus Staskawiczbacteria bacterium RIFCSPHIGHO2_01_FULL_41_41]